MEYRESTYTKHYLMAAKRHEGGGEFEWLEKADIYVDYPWAETVEGVPTIDHMTIEVKHNGKVYKGKGLDFNDMIANLIGKKRDEVIEPTKELARFLTLKSKFEFTAILH